ncbi:MAG: class I SAM-dependent methyltransferase [Planctomycetes bacterium]|nr:class I SAM-dependent methyltransferase [Planctomycetota bacterium]
MSVQVPVRLGTVQETLLVPLWARARECDEPAPVLTDPTSREILNRLDYDFGPLDGARASQLGCCVRGAQVDRWASQFLERHPEGTVIELGVGLNSRFERVDNGRARWFELDLPDAMELRREFFEDTPQRTMLSGSALDDDWIERVRSETQGPYFIASEGMLVYLDPDEVRRLFTRVADAFPGAMFAYDSMSPLVLRHQRKHDAMRYFTAEFTWSVGDAREVEQWDERYRLKDIRSFYHMLYAHPKRLPAYYRYLGPLLGAVYPPVKRAYHVNLLQLG